MISQTETILSRIERQTQNEIEQQYFWTHIERYRFLLERLKDRPRGKKILDVGCRPFHLGGALRELGWDVWGISSLHEPITEDHKVKTLNIETDKFPFKDEEFDIVLFTEVIEHLLIPQIPLEEIYRVLKKTGVLILTTPNKISPLIAFRRIFFANKNEKNNSSIYNRHNKEYSMGELIKLIEKIDLKIKTTEFFISYTPFRKRKIPDNYFIKFIKVINFILMKIFPPLRDTIYIEAEKT